VGVGVNVGTGVSGMTVITGGVGSGIAFGWGMWKVIPLITVTAAAVVSSFCRFRCIRRLRRTGTESSGFCPGGVNSRF
jgi:hypothetical protein